MHASRLATIVLFAGALAITGIAHSSADSPRAQQPATKSSGVGGEVARGKILYRENCDVCHYSASAEKKIGPGLKGLGKRHTFADGKKVDDANLREWIEKGGKDMPAFRDTLKPEQIRALVAYLKTL